MFNNLTKSLDHSRITSVIFFFFPIVILSSNRIFPQNIQNQHRSIQAAVAGVNVEGVEAHCIQPSPLKHLRRIFEKDPAEVEDHASLPVIILGPEPGVCLVHR